MNLSLTEEVCIRDSAIRTIIATKNNLHFWGGGGIVYDSDVKAEFQETLDKIAPIISVLESSDS